MTHNRKRFWQYSSLLVADLAVFGFTNSQNVASPVLMIGFLLLAVSLYSLVYGVISFARLYGIVPRQKKRLAGTITALLALLVALQSVGQLNNWDIVVVLALAGIGYAYSHYSSYHPA